MTKRPLKIAASILAADFSRLGDEITSADAGGAEWIHLDVMDGHFVPNVTFGAPVIKSNRKVTKRFFDVHVMASPVDALLPDLASAGADGISVHAEAGPHLARSLQAIREFGKRAGAALNPATPVSALEHVIDSLDLILVMTVNPGFGGQKFIMPMLDKIKQAKALAGGRDIDIEVDGGVDLNTAPLAARAGANVLVAGTSIFSKQKHAEAISALRVAAESVAV